MTGDTPAAAHRFLVRASQSVGFGHHCRVDDGTDYRLLDIGDLRRLERFGPRILDRPALAEGGFPSRDPAAWTTADARFERDGETGPGRWITVDPGIEAPWPVVVGGLALEIRLAPSGQVGCFPEQAPTWAWLADWIAAVGTSQIEVLHLFGHTGGSTLAAARAGARVVHVDAGRPSLAWARRNAELNGLTDAPIRWIADDAAAFVRREARRGRHYDGIVLDPPSFGHGPGGNAWRLADDLPDLLAGSAGLLGDGPAFVVLSAHTPGFGAERLGQAVADALGPRRAGRIDVDELSLEADSGRVLGLGAVARWSR
jgi:23S rRNA (cytosine1962-C5)-methyltransferase